MAYTSQSEIESAISSQTVQDLTDDANTGAIITARVTDAIIWADEQIDGYCQAHFEVPIVPTPAIVGNLSLTLAIWYLYRRRRNAFGVPESIEDDYKMAMRQLERINEGKLDLGITPIPAASSKAVAQSSGPDPLFTADTLKDM